MELLELQAYRRVFVNSTINVWYNRTAYVTKYTADLQQK